ncbi:MAG: YMGG-like glycine zipper-containing protein [Pyrinomonadaceae bacterium]|nr:YMGG-like glycine zipper-containing protein [Pyrinomonadaceae bacterium]
MSRVYLENSNETITVASVYDKTSETADLSINGNQNTGGGNINDYIIANNTRLSAALRTPISTKVSQNGDRFQMEVTAPSQYNGAIIEGRVAKTERSGRVSGRANVSLEFDTIRLRNGQTYRFSGIVDDVTLANGEKVTVNNEGTVRDNNQTTKTVTRAGIGAALGALIGAIAGGGQGAAIGAGVGAGAGAGSVILQGRDDIELGEGTTFSITASAPNNGGSNR